jgi:hypothetical protein
MLTGQFFKRIDGAGDTATGKKAYPESDDFGQIAPFLYLAPLLWDGADVGFVCMEFHGAIFSASNLETQPLP